MPLMDALRRLAPFRTVLDLGCHCGCLVPLFQTASAAVAVTGVDLSDEALSAARMVYPKHVWIEASLPEWLPVAAAAGKTYDVAISASVLGHISPDEIDTTLAALSRVATHGIVMQAQVALPGFPEGRVDSAGVWEWRYNYPQRLAALGWLVTAGHWLQVNGPQPNALLVFERRLA